MFKKATLDLCLLLAAFCCFSSTYAGNDMPPKPVDNKVMDAMVGRWQGESNMMGIKMNDTVNISWVLNHQFLTIQLESKAVNDPSNHYEGMGLFGVEPNNKVKAWWFDSWGVPAVSTGTGTTQNNKLFLKDGNQMFNEERTFEINDNELIMHAKGSMKMNDKNIPFEQAVVYKKQN